MIKHSWVVGVLVLLANMAPAQARSKGWVPHAAWNAVKAFSRANFDPQSRLFKTSTTIKDSRGLKNTFGRAYIVGVKLNANPAVQQFWPNHSNRKVYYLATKNVRGKWNVTSLAGVGGYKSTVDANGNNPRVGVGVAFNLPSRVVHGVKVRNASGLSVTRGRVVASKKTGKYTNTVFVNGDQNQGNWYGPTKAEIQVTPRKQAAPVTIPVNFGQVLMAR